MMQLDELKGLCARLSQEIGRVVVGQQQVVDGLLVALLSGGHILLEGVPGTAKTLSAQAFAGCLDLQMNRIQFTPDLMPSDVVGTNLFNFKTSEFTLTRGPVFSDLLLADEINRTPPKTQSALLQAMQERQVTIDGESYPLPPTFMVVATQNPIEQEGTYPLPEAQLDRFLLKLIVSYPSLDEEREIVRRHGSRAVMPNVASYGLQKLSDRDTILRAQQLVASLKLSDELVCYVVDLVRATRQHTAILHGASPRAANMIATAARALAALRGRDFVIPDDIKHLYHAAMRHRIMLSPAAEVEGTPPDTVLSAILESVPAPR